MRARLRHAVWLLVAVALVFAVSSACQLIGGIRKVVQDDCQACAQAQCAAQSASCAGSAGCNALENCLFGCNGEPMCRSQCTRTNPVVPLSENDGVEYRGADTMFAGTLNACLASQCESECGLTCGALSQIAPPDAVPSCAACLQANDCTSAAESASDPLNQSYLLCRQNCVTGDCIGACINPKTGFFAFLQTVEASCASACAVGSNWACVGDVHWPQAEAQIRHVALHYLEDLEGHDEVGVTVFMCKATDPNCQNPVSSSETDSEGGVILTDSTDSMLNQNLGLDGFLAMNARAGDASAADSLLYPTLVYWGFPVTAANGVIAEPLPVPTLVDWTQDLPGVSAGLDSTQGVVAAVALDCFGDKAPDVSFALSGAGDAGEPTPLYLAGFSPITMSAGPGPGTVAAIFANVSPGPVDVIATPTGLGRPSSRVSVYVRPSTLTEVFLQPTPDPLDAGEAP